MPFPVLLLILATLLPLLSFGVLLTVGRRMGAPAAGWVGTGVAIGSFLCSLSAMVGWMQAGQGSDAVWGFGNKAVYYSAKWLPVAAPLLPPAAGGTSAAPGVRPDHPGWLDLGVYVDSLTVVMFAMVTLVSALVHLFSIGYMRRDPRFARFFAYLALFCFSMLGLVLGGTVLQIFIFWELVGLCSYLLVGFWYERPTAANAAIKAFVVNRVGDVGFLVGFGILFHHLGNVALPHLWLALGDAGRGGAIALPDGGVFSAGLLTATGICLFCGAIGKSAQFPLHVWLPDAMEGPTPASALIHAATMVAAGVYLLGRIFPILTPGAKLFVAIIGCVTLTMAALIAVAQTDIKRVLAYSTVSQLGFMVMAIGLGSWVGGLFHLVTHAFFKALLFLGAGSVIFASHHEQELTQFGGLWRKIPWTAATFGVAVLAIAGTPFFSGYYSKDLILAHAGAFATLATGQGRPSWYWAFFVVPTLVAYLTAFYMTRCWMLTFWGEPRNRPVYERARETPIMWAPMVALAVLSVLAGRWMNVRELLEGSIKESTAYVRTLADREPTGFYRNRALAGWATAWPAETLPRAVGDDAAVEPSASQAAHERGERLAFWFVLWAFAVGIGLGVAIYWRGDGLARRIVRVTPVNWIHRWLYRRMYFDELYYALVVGVTLFLARLSGWLDRHVVDGIVNGAARLVRAVATGAGAGDRVVIDGAVDGIGRLTQGFGAAVRTPQSGRIRLYVLMLFAAIALAAATAVTIALSR